MWTKFRGGEFSFNSQLSFEPVTQCFSGGEQSLLRDKFTTAGMNGGSAIKLRDLSIHFSCFILWDKSGTYLYSLFFARNSRTLHWSDIPIGRKLRNKRVNGKNWTFVPPSVFALNREYLLVSVRDFTKFSIELITKLSKIGFWYYRKRRGQFAECYKNISVPPFSTILAFQTDVWFT